MHQRPNREMRNGASRFRGAPQQQSRIQNPEPPTRKVFNCIVDDTALMIGLKKNTRDGIRKWVNMGAIRLFVPLYSLEHLNTLSKGKDRNAADAREALRWLDEITSLPNIQSAGTVQLQGPDQIYNTWEEVEQFLLPEPLLSMDDTDHESDILLAELDSLTMAGESDQASLSSSQSIDIRPTTPSSPRSSYSANSPGLVNANPYGTMEAESTPDSADRTARNSTEMQRSEGRKKGAVPLSLRPLINHILWLIHQEPNAAAALNNYILLTNDGLKQSCSQRYGIRARRLEQLRDLIAREDKDYKNQLQFFKKENNGTAARPPAIAPSKPTREIVPEESASDDEDVVLLKPGSRGSATAAGGQRVMDPNEFSRSPTTQHSPRGGRGGRGMGRGTSRGGHRAPVMNGSTHHSPAENQQIGKGLPRGPRNATDLTKPIDPDSFARPSPAGRSLRGGRRKLWEPT